MKIALAVHGRFHAFDLACALIRRGHKVTLLTNYPRWAVARFGVTAEQVRSFWLHGVLARVAGRVSRLGKNGGADRWLHQLFGRWAAAELGKEPWDVVHLWSSVAEESLRALTGKATLRFLVRGSAHIRAQARLLEEEEQRTGAQQERPSAWIIAREEREYALADRIVVLSTFAYRTFIAQGVPSDRLSLLPSGVGLDAFRPPPEVVDARRRRILSGEPLRVLYVGTVSFRKGMWDLAAVARRLGDRGFRFQIVGPHAVEVAPLAAQLREHAVFTPKQPQGRLPGVYALGDVFVFPTIEDGYPQVLAQAAASGLPILTTTNCSGPDLVREGENGWLFPIRSPEAVIERLLWCGTHRVELAAMARRVYDEFRPREWSETATEFEELCRVERWERRL